MTARAAAALIGLLTIAAFLAVLNVAVQLGWVS